MHFIRPSVAFSLAFALAACVKTDERPADTTSTTTTTTDTTSTTVTTPPTTSPAPGGATTQPQQPPVVTPPTSGSTVNENGIGNLRVGMTEAEAKAVVPAFSVAPSPEGTECTYARTNGLPPGVGVMMDGGKIVRVEVRRGSIATSTGARIGDSEDRIKTLYPGQVTVTPHKYTDGHYLTVAPPSSADRIIFETDGKRVVNYRAGQQPQVAYVEGCS